MVLPTGLLESVKTYLDITWNDNHTESKLTGIIARGISYLDDTAGAKLDYTKEDKPKELLLEYCMYARSNALSEFENNYLSELLKLQIRQEVADYAAEQAGTIVH